MTLELRLGPWDALHVGSDREQRAAVVIFHGFGMRAEDLSPFARSMGAPANFYLPQGTLALESGARAWWPIDQERRAARQVEGPADLCDIDPAERASVRAQLGEFLAAVRARDDAPLILVGFSQGGMLACDYLLHERPILRGLGMLSSSRIAIGEWTARRAAAAGLPVLLSHGRSDDDLSFAAGENLRDFLQESGAQVTWIPFDGGHEIPLVVWRGLRQFIRGVTP